MSKDEKILKRFLTRPKDFTYNELCKLLKSFDYIELQSSKTSGLRVAFYSKVTNHIIRLHKPHPSNELKQYQIEQIIDELESRGLI